jgi:hypothetical protein
MQKNTQKNPDVLQHTMTNASGIAMSLSTADDNQ